MLAGALGVMGGVIDLIVGIILTQPPAPAPGMMMRPQMVGWEYGLFLIGLGVVVMATGVLLFIPRVRVPMPLSGGLMVAYGVLMLAIGATMLGGMTPMVQEATLSGLAMIAVGILMLASGLDMLHRKGRPMA